MKIEKTCEKCGNKIEMSRKDKMLRKLVGQNSRLFPALEEICNSAENYCNDCYKEKVKGAAMSIAGVKEIDES